MPTNDQMRRMIILFYRSNNAHDFTNLSRPIDWLDKLPMKGLAELDRMFEVMREDVQHEIQQRIEDGMPRFSREWYERERKGESHD